MFLEHCQGDVNKLDFPQRIIEMWNKLDPEIVHAGIVNKVWAKLDKIRHGDGTEWV